MACPAILRCLNALPPCTYAFLSRFLLWSSQHKSCSDSLKGQLLLELHSGFALPWTGILHQLSRHWGNPRLEVVQDFCTSMVCINPWSHDVPRYPIVCGSKCLMDSVPHRFKLGECSPFQPLDSRALRHSAELGRPCCLPKDQFQHSRPKAHGAEIQSCKQRYAA